MTHGKSRAVWFVLIPALTMWMAWGVRGVRGNGGNRAMIPGALVALSVCTLLKEKQVSPGLAVALTAVGFGFGADETTLQTAGYLSGSNTDHIVKLGVAYSGLALKGGLWALFGGAGLGLALAAHFYRKRDIVIGVLLLISAFYLGWFVINRPKLIYFSLDRKEIWGGLLLGGIVFLGWLTVRGQTKIPLQLSGWAALGGAVGYPIAVTLRTIGGHSAHAAGHDWWKLAETTFGFFMGAAIGMGAYLVRDQLPSRDESYAPTSASTSWGVVLAGAIGGAAVNVIDGGVSGVMIGHGHGTWYHLYTLPWILLGAVLLCLAFCWRKTAWHIGATVVFAAAVSDLFLNWFHDSGVGMPPFLWIPAAVLLLGLAWKVTGWANCDTNAEVPRKAFLWIMWAVVIPTYGLAIASYKILNPPANAVAQAGGLWPYLFRAWGNTLEVAVGFTVAAVLLAWWQRPELDCPAPR